MEKLQFVYSERQQNWTSTQLQFIRMKTKVHYIDIKADESYLVGSDLGPAESYLNIERIIDVAKQANVDAIHPRYGFLSENEQFARRCAEEGIKFIGPHLEHLDMFGDKVKARTTAIKADLPVIPGYRRSN